MLEAVGEQVARSGSALKTIGHLRIDLAHHARDTFAIHRSTVP